ncbi:MAG TPA: heavy-metal-associated domain-containing protein [Bacteroidales bacterium]|nr:heavy-metal-associated domain-containing protein [Bacteroidales bacterium]
MRTKVLSLLVVLVMGVTSLMAQDQKKEEFKVAGNCDMCKTRIEKAAKTVDGVAEASWDTKTKMLALTFSTDKPNAEAVHKAVAKVGHDTELFKAEKEVYDKLPACCKYERMAEKLEK